MRQEAAYPAVQSICIEYNVSISRMCAIAGIARASYYKWLNREIPEVELLNEAIAEAVMSIHKEYPDKGHRRIRDDLLRDCGFDVSDRSVLRICRIPGIKSTIKYERNSCTKCKGSSAHIREYTEAQLQSRCTK